MWPPLKPTQRLDRWNITSFYHCAFSASQQGKYFFLFYNLMNSSNVFLPFTDGRLLSGLSNWLGEKETFGGEKNPKKTLLTQWWLLEQCQKIALSIFQPYVPSPYGLSLLCIQVLFEPRSLIMLNALFGSIVIIAFNDFSKRLGFSPTHLFRNE